jgi:hypothetical protein
VRAAASSRQEDERVGVTRPDDAEVAAVDGRELGEAEPLRGGDDRRVDRAEREVAVAGDELGNAQPVGGEHGLDRECARGKVAEEADLWLDAEACAEEERDLSDDERGNDQRTWMRLEKLEGRSVVGVVRVDVGVEGTRVDDDPGYRLTSAARISSIRADTSLTPLWPALAAPSRRRPEVPTR